MLFDTGITSGVHCATFTFGRSPGASNNLTGGKFIFSIMPYLNFILVDNKVSHSVEITSWIRYIDNIHTLFMIVGKYKIDIQEL